MSGNVESLVFDLLVRDRASEGVSKLGRTMEGAAKDTDTLTKRLNELSRKSVEARVKLAGDKEAQAALDKMDSRLITLDKRVASPNLRIEGIARAIAEISAVDLELDKLGGKGGTAEAATSAIGAGGLSGPGGMGALIGAGVILSPVIATLGIGLGGLGLAAFGVTKNAKLMKTELAPLKDEFHAFSASLQPEVLDAFGSGVRLAGHLLHDIQPVAAATGKALDGVLGQIDAEFQSGTWQDFFGFMARTAGPDMQLLGNVFVQLADDIPPILTQLQPLASGFLKDTDAVLKLVNAGTQLVAWEHQHAAAVSNDTGMLGRFGHAAEKAFEQMFPGVKAARALQQGLDHVGGSSSATAPKVTGVGNAAGGAAVKMQTLTQQVNSLSAAEDKSLSPLLAYTGAMLTQRTDAGKLSDALKISRDRVGLNTAAERASFSAANTYIQDLLTTASAAVKSHQGIDAQIGSIRNALPLLRNVRGGTREYWQEVQSLVSWLNRLRQIKLISEHVHITGDGQWAFVQGGGQNMRIHAAAGARIPGYGGGDRWPALLEGGEAVVDKQTTAAHAAELRSWGVPGFAAGGIVPSYSGTPGGLQPWGQHNRDATIATITAGIAKAMLRDAGSGPAIVAYARQFLGQIPYVMGGNSLSGGIDCSGFVQQIYSRFGINAPRTSETQFGWVRRTGPVPGGLAFYVSPGGGPPPGHVAIVQDANTVISQGGGMGPRIMGLHAMPLMGTGVPRAGFGSAAGAGGGNGPVMGGGSGGTMSAGAIASLWTSMGGPGFAAANMARIAFAESGDRPGAVQAGQPPGRTGWGLYQVTPTSGIGQNGAYGNLLNAANNTRAAISLFSQSGYGPWASDPVAAGLLGGGARHIFDTGYGVLPPGLSLSYNGTGRPEALQPAGRGGGATIIINVHASPLARPADIGREVVGAIKAYEKGSGPGWRK